MPLALAGPGASPVLVPEPSPTSGSSRCGYAWVMGRAWMRPCGALRVATGVGVGDGYDTLPFIRNPTILIERGRVRGNSVGSVQGAGEIFRGRVKS